MEANNLPIITKRDICAGVDFHTRVRDEVKFIIVDCAKCETFNQSLFCINLHLHIFLRTNILTFLRCFCRTTKFKSVFQNSTRTPCPLKSHLQLIQPSPTIITTDLLQSTCTFHNPKAPFTLKIGNLRTNYFRIPHMHRV